MSDLEFDLANTVAEYLERASPSRAPVLVHMLGIPGSGKTTFARALHRCLSSQQPGMFTYVSFDHLMEAISTYRIDGDLRSEFAKYELPARSAGYALLKELLERKVSVLFDHGGANPEHIGLIRYAAEALGYQAFVIYIRCSVNVAKERVSQRMKIEGRYTPLEYVDNRFKVISTLVSEYLNLSDRFLMIDNSEDNMLDIEGLANSASGLIFASTFGAK